MFVALSSSVSEPPHNGHHSLTGLCAATSQVECSYLFVRSWLNPPCLAAVIESGALEMIIDSMKRWRERSAIQHVGMNALGQFLANYASNGETQPGASKAAGCHPELRLPCCAVCHVCHLPHVLCAASAVRAV